jgi:hypothetical protein
MSLGVKASFQVLLVKQSVTIHFTLTYESALSTREKTVDEEEAWITRYLYNPFLHLKPTPQPHRQPCPLSLPSNRLHSLRVIKQFRRIINTLNILQPRQACSVVVLACSRPVQPWIRVVNIHPPVVSG